jgi:hypothetical protein
MKSNAIPKRPFSCQTLWLIDPNGLKESPHGASVLGEPIGVVGGIK